MKRLLAITKEELIEIMSCMAAKTVPERGLWERMKELHESFSEPCPHHWLTDTNIQLLSNPPKYRLLCSNCFEITTIPCSEYDAKMKKKGLNKISLSDLHYHE